MIALVTYDITHPRRLRRMHKFLKEFGIHTQLSVFECPVDEEGLKKIRAYCREELDLDEDSVRIYKICAGCLEKAEISGRGLKMTQYDFMVM